MLVYVRGRKTEGVGWNPPPKKTCIRRLRLNGIRERSWNYRGWRISLK